MQRPLIAVLGLGMAALMSPDPCSAQVTVVNVVPALNSAETSNNPEANLAVKDASLKTLAVTAHLPGRGWCVNQTLNGLFASTDGGSTWTLVCAVLPQAPPTDKPGDFTTRFSGTGAWLYVSGLLPGGIPSLVASANVLSGTAYMNLLGTNPSIGNVDQPQLRTARLPAYATGIAEVDDGYTDTNGDSITDCYRGRFLGTTTLPPSISLESQCTALRVREERPWATRIAVHDSGVTYVALLEVKTNDANVTHGDVVVLRGKPFDTSAPHALHAIQESGTTTTNICDPSDGQIGIRVVTCVPLAWDGSLNPNFGFEVRRGALAIAVDPTNSQTVYIAWADSADVALMQTVHVRKSTNGGMTWPPTDLFAIPNATNPSLAVDASGRLGFLSQQYVASRTNARWHTRLRVLPLVGDAQDILLADTPAVDPAPDRTTPYQGDYTDVVAVGSTFLGVFAARNDPAEVVFPYGVTYNRYCSNEKLRKAPSGSGVVKASVDPFFFRVGPGPIGQTVPGTGLNC